MRFLTCLIAIYVLSVFQVYGRTIGDFDGDGKTDLSLFRSNVAPQLTWHIQRSSDGGYSYFTWGRTFDSINGIVDAPVVGDFDGDGKNDFAIRRVDSNNGPEYFWILRSSDSIVQVVQWCLSQDVPVIQDYDGDGKDDIAVYRESDTAFYVLKSSGGILIKYVGFAGSPVTGDYDGDGKADFVNTYSGPETGFLRLFHIVRSSDGQTQLIQFGLFNDYVVPGDYDGDGKTDLAVWRGRQTINGWWYWLRSSDGQLAGVQFGQGDPLGDFPVPGDYDGDGKTDPAIFQSGPRVFWILYSSGGGLKVVQWGAVNDTPLMGANVRF